MKKVRITDAVALRAAPPTAGRSWLWDALLPGFGIRISASGYKTYAVRCTSGGKKITVTLGPVGKVTAHEARDAAWEALQRIERGDSPKPVTPAAPVADAIRTTVRQAFEEYAKKHLVRLRSGAEVRRALELHALPALDHLHVVEVRRKDVVPVLDALSGREATALQVFRLLRHFFNWQVQRGELEFSPMAGMKAAWKVPARERVLADGELGLICRGAERLGTPVREYVLLLILTAQRRAEVAQMRWAEIDLDAALWHLPRTRTKAGRNHIVPLSAAAIMLLKNLSQCRVCEFVLSTDGRSPIGGYSKIKSRLDREVKKVAGEAGEQGPLPWRIHDLRRTAATGMRRAGVDLLTVKAVLNHAEGAEDRGVTGAYDRWEALPEKRRALEDWGALVSAWVPVLSLLSESDGL